MKVQLVCFKPTQAAIDAGIPSLTPEAMGAVGARYSRNDEGLDVILELINKKSEDASIDSIFRMVDYGHASIGDMPPAAVFIDKISIWLTYYIWSICPKASGQETSTRYVEFDEGGIISPFLAGIPIADIPTWNKFITDSITNYKAATEFWLKVAEEQPELVRIPHSLLVKAAVEDESGHKARLAVARMKRNFAFDRSRYFIPVAAKTNVMLKMDARDWVELISTLASHYVLEANQLAEKLTHQLKLVFPRLMKHSLATPDKVKGHLIDLSEDATFFTGTLGVMVSTDPEIDPMYPNLIDSAVTAFDYHTNRYARIGRAAHRVFVTYYIDRIAMAELRDLNRHRTGYKFSPSMPFGFYAAEDQLEDFGTDLMPACQRLNFGYQAFLEQQKRVREEDKSHPYWGLLGTQYYYERGTTLAKLAYEIALRTGVGSHFKYSEHMREVHNKLIEEIPTLAGKILVGSAEPE